MDKPTEVTLADGWIAHDGSEFHLEDGQGINVQFRDGAVSTMKASEFYWQHEDRADDIIAYRPEPKP